VLFGVDRGDEHLTVSRQVAGDLVAVVSGVVGTRLLLLGDVALVLAETESRGVVGFEVILGAYMSLLSMAATGSVSLVV